MVRSTGIEPVTPNFGGSLRDGDRLKNCESCAFSLRFKAASSVPQKRGLSIFLHVPFLVLYVYQYLLMPLTDSPSIFSLKKYSPVFQFIMIDSLALLSHSPDEYCVFLCILSSASLNLSSYSPLKPCTLLLCQSIV